MVCGSMRELTTRQLLRICIFAIALALCGCGVGGKLGFGSDEEEEKPFGPSGIPPHLRSRDAQQGGSAVAPGGNQPTLPSNFEITPDEDLIFTDPDNPDAIIPELSTLLAEQSASRGPWEKSDTLARQRAMRENKAMMIWFTDSGRSPLCKALEEELFSAADFNAWASDHLVRLRIDANLAAIERKDELSLDESETLRIDVRNYVNSMRKRYRVMGYPAVLILDAEGQVLTRYPGYRRGEADLLFGKLRHAQSVASRNNERWRKKMETRGYREWQDSRGRVTIFARLANYHEGELILIEPDGNQVRTREANLSKNDKSWIAEEKRKRGL